MAVAFDAVGPSSAGAHTGTATSLSWSHTITGAGTVLLAAIAADTGTDTGITTTATYNGVPATSLGKVHSGAAAAGYLEVFGIVAAANAGASLVVTASTAVVLTGGSLSFTGASQTVGTAFGTPATANLPQNTSTPSAALASNTSGNIIAGFLANGSSITSATSPSASRFINNGGGGNAAGNAAAATSPATGSSVTMAWATTSDWYAELLVEVLPPGGTDTSPAYATAASDLGGGSGSWASPTNAEALDGSYATWTAP